MKARSQDFQDFLDQLDAALMPRLAPGGSAQRMMARVSERLNSVPGHEGLPPATLPVCDQLDAAFAVARSGDAATGRVAVALERLAPSLHWERRPTAKPGEQPFYDGHANATIIGPGGLELRNDVWVGVSLMAPHIDYPVHHHPPEEVYFVLSPGEWKQDDAPWFAPGIGGTVHNVPHVRHAMRSGTRPLLATWSLWVGN